MENVQLNNREFLDTILRIRGHGYVHYNENFIKETVTLVEFYSSISLIPLEN